MDAHVIPAGIRELAELERPLWPAIRSGIPEWHPRNEWAPSGAAPQTPAAQPEGADPAHEPEWEPWEPEPEPAQGYQQPQAQVAQAPDAMSQNVQLAREVSALQEHYGDAYAALEDKYEMSEGDAQVANTAAMHFAQQLGDQRLAFHPDFIELAYLAAMGVNGGQQPSKTPRRLEQMSDQEIGANVRDARHGHNLGEQERAAVQFWGR